MLTLFTTIVLSWASCSGALAGNNWAVIVCSSRYWFNYRHFANALSMYRTLKARGYDDDHIIFMSSMEPACDSRNPYVGEIFATRHEQQKDLYGNDTELDYKGTECNVESFMRLLTGRVPPNTPTSKLLMSDENSNILIYLTGHGGDEFLKFHDTQEVSTQDMAYVFREMKLKGRFREVLLIVDTCQASTFANSIVTSNIYTLTSSLQGENSYAYETNVALGVAVLDRFTHALVGFLDKHQDKKSTSKQAKKKTKKKKKNKSKSPSLRDLVNSFDQSFLYSTATLQMSPGTERNPANVPLADFFEQSPSQSGTDNKDEETHYRDQLIDTHFMKML